MASAVATGAGSTRRGFFKNLFAAAVIGVASTYGLKIEAVRKSFTLTPEMSAAIDRIFNEVYLPAIRDMLNRPRVFTPSGFVNPNFLTQGEEVSIGLILPR